MFGCLNQSSLDMRYCVFSGRDYSEGSAGAWRNRAALFVALRRQELRPGNGLEGQYPAAPSGSSFGKACRLAAQRNPGGLKRRRASAMLARRHRESHQYRRVTSSLLAATGAKRSQIRGPDFPSSTVTSTVNWRTGIERKSPDKDKSAGRGHGNLQYIFNPKSHFGLGNQRILAS